MVFSSPRNPKGPLFATKAYLGEAVRGAAVFQGCAAPGPKEDRHYRSFLPLATTGQA